MRILIVFLIIKALQISATIFDRNVTDQRPIVKRQIAFYNPVYANSIIPTYSFYQPQYFLPLVSYYVPQWVYVYYPTMYYPIHQNSYAQSYPTPPPVYPTPPPVYATPMPRLVTPPRSMLRNLAADIVPVTTPAPTTTTVHQDSQEEIVEITVTDEAIVESEFSSSASPVTTSAPGFQMPLPPVGFAADMDNRMFTPHLAEPKENGTSTVSIVVVETTSPVTISSTTRTSITTTTITTTTTGSTTTTTTTATTTTTTTTMTTTTTTTLTARTVETVETRFSTPLSLRPNLPLIARSLLRKLTSLPLTTSTATATTGNPSSTTTSPTSPALTGSPSTLAILTSSPSILTNPPPTLAASTNYPPTLATLTNPPPTLAASTNSPSILANSPSASINSPPTLPTSTSSPSIFATSTDQPFSHSTKKSKFWSDLNANNTVVGDFNDISAISARNFEKMRNFNPKNYTMRPEMVKKRIDRIQKKGDWTKTGPEVFDHISNIIDNLEIPTDEDLEASSERRTVTKHFTNKDLH